MSKEKANMLYSTEDIFRNARYLYSTQDYAGDPNVYRWNYFYTPVQIGNETVGVRIAVRDVANPGESQIYNWGIKKDASLDDVGRGTDNRISHGASSDASINNISQTMPGVNGEISSAEEQVLRGNDAVQIADIDTAGNGKLTVKLADGSTADVSELSFPDMGEQELWRVLAEHSDNAEAARQLLKEYRAGDLKAFEFAKGVEEGFVYGKLNISEGEMSQRGSYVNLLNPMQRNMAYKYGQYAGEKQAKQRQANVDAVYKQAKSVLQQKGKTYKDTYRAVAVDGISVENMKPSQKEAFHLAEMIAPGIQANIEVYNGGKEWGYYNPKTDTIRLNINANWNKRSMLAFTLGHELIHRTKRGSPVKYKAFADFLVQQYGKQGSSIKDMIAEQLAAAEAHDKTVPENQRLNMTEEQAFEEVVADACQRMLLDTNAGQRLAEFGAQSEQNRDFLHRFAKKLREILNKLREIFKNVVPDSLAAQEFARFDANTKRILADMFVDMSIDAGEKLSTIKEAGLTEKITTENGGVKKKVGSTQNAPYRKPAYDEWDVSNALNDALDHADEGVDNLIRVGEIPHFISDSLGISGDFYVYRNHAYENMVSAEKAKKDGRFNAKAHYHNLGFETMTNAIMALENPIMTIASKTKTGNPAVIMLLPVEGKNKAPLYAVLSFYSNKSINGDYSRKPHVVLTVAERNYIEDGGRAGLVDVIDNAVNENRVISFNKKMREHLSVNTKATSLGIITEKSLADNLAQFRKEINSFREKNKINYKLPVSKDISNREMLVDMFEQMVTSSNEYKALENYRKHIQEILDIEEHLERISAEIRRLSFAEGPRDTETLNRLKLQQKQAVNRLNTYDGILLRLEKSGVLRAMIERNRKKITQESIDSARAYYRERNERRESELVADWLVDYTNRNKLINSPGAVSLLRVFTSENIRQG